MPGAINSRRLRSCAAQEGTTLTDSESLARTLPWRNIAALVVSMLALGGWVFGQDELAAARVATPPARAR
jgi:hypothetical protein